MKNSAIDKEGYMSVHVSDDKSKFIALTAGGLPLSLHTTHKNLLSVLDVDWMTSECVNVEFFYKGKGQSIKNFLNSQK